MISWFAMRYNIRRKSLNLISHGNVSDRVLNIEHLAFKDVVVASM